MFKIEKNIPLTAKTSYPFEQMENGDSFFIPNLDNQRVNYVRAHLHNMKKKNKGMIISTRKEDGGLRVWLINKG